MRTQISFFSAALLLCPMCLLARGHGGWGGGQRGSSGYIPQLYRGQEALKAKKWSSAASYFRTALEWNRNGVEAHLGLANVYLHRGQMKRAIEEYNVVFRLNPHSAEAERGVHQARSAGEEDAAFLALQEQVKAEPNNADALTTYAEELVERNRLEEGQKEAELALRLEPGLGHAYCALGRIAAREGKDDEAQKDLLIATRRDSTDDDAFSTLGDLAMKAKDYKQAVTYYRRVVQIVPDETEGYQKLIAALTAAGDTRGADRAKTLLDRLTPTPDTKP
jgi:Tfp pilus assembly protein PilF